MPTNLELKSYQKRFLHQLLMIKSKTKGETPEILDEYIDLIEIEMEPEDVAYVQKKFENRTAANR